MLKQLLNNFEKKKTQKRPENDFSNFGENN